MFKVKNNERQLKRAIEHCTDCTEVMCQHHALMVRGVVPPPPLFSHEESPVNMARMAAQIESMRLDFRAP